MVEVEIFRTILLEINDAQFLGGNDRAYVCSPTCRCFAWNNAQRSERCDNLGFLFIGRFGKRKIDRPYVARTEVGFHRKGMRLGGVLRAIILAAPNSHFFGPGPQQANGAFRLTQRF
jgi:hypothetical protein